MGLLAALMLDPGEAAALPESAEAKVAWVSPVEHSADHVLETATSGLAYMLLHSP